MTKPVSISTMGALTVPDESLNSLEIEYRHLRKSLPTDKGEVKGRQLSEAHICDVIRLLFEHKAVFHCAAIDIGDHTAEEISLHKRRQTEAASANLTDQHHPSLKASIAEMQAGMMKFPNQLYVQSIVTFRLIHRVIIEASTYYVQRFPQELGAFHWIIDAKDRANPITPWEKWWSMFVMPSLQAISAKSPFPMLEGEDYSYFEKFYMPWQSWAAPDIEPTETNGMLNIRSIMTENFRFSDLPEPGLELVDILTNAAKRALSGNLSFEGWKFLPRIMIHRKYHYIDMLYLHDRESPKKRPYYPVLGEFTRQGRNMLT